MLFALIIAAVCGFTAGLILGASYVLLRVQPELDLLRDMVRENGQ